jgi:hypothetical protein
VLGKSPPAAAASVVVTAPPPGWLGIGSPRHAAVHLIIIVTLARLVFADSLGLGEDGAYSAAIARHFSLSYFDHAPMHYWLVGITEWVTGSTAPFVLRLPFILLSIGSTWFLYKLTALAFGERAGLWAIVAYSLAVFFLLLPLYVGPDGPLIFFLLLTAWLVARAVLVDSPRPNLRWAAAGLAGGGALLSKYSAVFLLAGVFLFLVTSAEQRRWLVRPGPWIALVISAVAFAPVIIWNSQHAWISLFFQGGRALQHDTGGLASVVKGLLSQYGYLAPYFMPLLLVALVRGLAGGPADKNTWFFACLATVPIAVFTTLNFFHPGLPHWSMPGWLFTFPLLGAATARLPSAALLRARRVSVATAAVMAVIAAGFVGYVRAGYFDGPIGGLLKPKPYFGNDILREFLDWRDIGPILRDRGLLDDKSQFLAGLTWQSTGRIDQVFGSDLSVLCACATPNHFRFATDLAKFAGENALIIDRPDNFMAYAALLDRAFARREPLSPIVIRRGRDPAITLQVERGIGFRPEAIESRWRDAGEAGVARGKPGA